jgi:hypothetical protein
MKTIFWSIAIILGLTVLAFAQPRAEINISEDKEEFLILYEKGAVWFCTVFEHQGGSYPAPENYAPRHCGQLDPSLGFYEDNWEYICVPSEPYCTTYDADWIVYAVIQYPTNIINSDGSSELFSVETNKIKVHR